MINHKNESLYKKIELSICRLMLSLIKLLLVLIVLAFRSTTDLVHKEFTKTNVENNRDCTNFYERAANVSAMLIVKFLRE